MFYSQINYFKLNYVTFLYLTRIPSYLYIVNAMLHWHWACSHWTKLFKMPYITIYLLVLDYSSVTIKYIHQCCIIPVSAPPPSVTPRGQLIVQAKSAIWTLYFFIVVNVIVLGTMCDNFRFLRWKLCPWHAFEVDRDDDTALL